ncbi:MAG: glycoside hydrolase family 78 protein [Actinomycetota bacterium]|nr:glycoside hydrolase family 78 protein [Actinomycetota bacterium]
MSTTPRAVSLRAEYRIDTAFTASATPRLSWATETESDGWLQAGAELELTRGSGTTSLAVTGRDSVLLDWPFEPIAPRETLSLRVRVTGEDGGASDWSAPLALVGGQLGDGEWSAHFIGLDDETPTHPARLRAEFAVDGEVVRATLYATAHGAYQVEINGTQVDDQILKPGWTSYQWRLTHETTDVTALLSDGANAIGIDLAGAWFTESFGFRHGAAGFYGTRPAVAAQLVIEYADGRSETLVTDGSWWASGDGPITASGIYAGEDTDARRAQAGWSSVGYDASGWTPARIEAAGDTSIDTTVILTPRSAPAVREIETLAVQEVITTPEGKTIVDFGQNLVGYLHLKVSGPSGTVLTMRHAEVLEHGELGVRPLRAAAATDTFTFAGTGAAEEWKPRFTFHGFRYAEISGWPGEFDPDAVTAVVVHSDMERTGWFDSSHALVNRLHENVLWGMRGNFLYLPTDCPQRDERLGWTGDIQVFAPTASFLYNCDGFLAGWLRDLDLEQKHSDGIVPFIVPNVLGPAVPAAAWGDAATVVPTVLRERFGDTGVVREQFDSMKAWSDALLDIAGERLLWEDRFQFGDWLDPDASPDFPADAKTDADIVASAYLYRSVDFTARAAALLGEDADAAKYSEIAARVKDAFLAEYVSDSGRMMSDAQTGYATAIMFGLSCDAAQEQRMGDRLAHLTRASGYRIGTGFVGTPLITDALTRTGHDDTAMRLLTQTENPSWLYPVTMGATTIWERWDSMLEDGSINPGEMTSFNHYALGAVADWMHRRLAGLAPGEAGYRRLLIAPRPLNGFTSASARHLTPYGIASAGWVREGDTVTVSIVVPPNADANVILPGTTEAILVGSGSHSWQLSYPDTTEAPRELSIDSPLSEIIDHPTAFSVLADAIAAEDEEQAVIFRKHTRWTPGRPLGESIRRTPPPVVAAVESALAGLNTQRS